MSNSTLDLLSGLLTPDLLRTAARATGESEGGIAKALGASFPAILGQLAQGSANTSMMSSVIDLVKNPVVGSMLGSGGGVLGQVGSILTHGEKASGIGPIASSILEMLFGKNVAAIAGAIGSFAGLRNSGTAMSLLKLAGPMVLAAIGNRLGGALTPAALGSLLGKEKDGIMSALPGPLAGAMGLMGGAGAGLAQTAGRVATAAGAVGAAAAAARPAVAAPLAPKAAAVAPAAAVAYDDEPTGGSSIGGSIVGLLITGAVLAGIVFGISQCNRKAEPPPAAKAAAPAAAPTPAPAPAPAKMAEAPKPPPAPVATAAPAAAPVAAPAPVAPAPAPVAKAASLLDALKPGEGGLMNLTLPNGKTVSFAGKGVESQLIAFLEDTSKPIDKGTWFDFDRLSFKTASSELTPESRSQVEAVAEIMKAFPTSEIKIGGYTDNVGNPDNNLKLSDERAKSVMAALVALGVPASRLDAEGYGEQHAIADNATPEGRAKNRRTALSVRKR